MNHDDLQDATLGDLTELLATDTAVLRAQTCVAQTHRSATIESAERHWVRYAPESQCVAVFRVRGWLNELPYATFVVARRTEAETVWATAIDDPVLTELPVVLDPQRVGEALGSFAAGATATPLRYRPGRRCTLRIESDNGLTFAKVLADGAQRQRSFLDTHRSAGPNGFALPRVCEPQAVSRFVVTEPVDGISAWSVLKSSATATDEQMQLSQGIGTRLADLHRLPPDGLPTTSRNDELCSLSARLDVIDRLDPVTALSARQVVDRMATTPIAESVASTCHGSFRFDQVIVNSGRFTLMDFDSLGAAPAESDLGNCLAYLTWRQVRDPEANTALQAIRAALLDGYRAAGGVIDPLRLAYFHAASCLKIAWRRFANLDVAEWPLVPNLLAVASDQLSAPNESELAW